MPVLALGFRPFYLLAALFAAAALPLWTAVYAGRVQLDGYLSSVAWHSHEMLFGFAVAVVAGFLLTAVRTWTGLPTVNGWRLGMLAALWVLGRVTALTGPETIAAAVDAAFLPALVLALGLPIWRSRNVRNVKVLALIIALAFGNAVYHSAQLRYLPIAYAPLVMTVALDVVTILMAVVGGRVIPAFTANAIPKAQPRRIISVEVVSIVALLGILVADVTSVWIPLSRTVWVVLLTTAALAHGVRLTLWQPQLTRRNALLVMLPIAYAWIPLALILRALAQVELLSPAAGVHALTIGAMGSLMLAMMMRSALGHTGRPLVAGWSECAAFLLVQLSAVVRLFGAAVPMLPYRTTVVTSGTLWSLAFIVFLVAYGLPLTRARIDGKPG